ncbi:MAG: AMIN domain-containing protein, partial [Synechococcaceae bacterium WB8_1B_136]|nr:AMIN domain-containing protein [Synechococcaceae bacterium WB8_1B_136]
MRRRLSGLLFTAVVPLCTLLAGLPAWAGSALSAWRISRDGALELRTSPDVQLQAFFEAGRGGIGPRVWIDLPGAPQRTRTIAGNGVVRQVRIGRPDGTATRLVVEFQPGTRLDPAGLKLVGTARDRWRMDFAGVATGLLPLGEGDFDAPFTPS